MFFNTLICLKIRLIKWRKNAFLMITKEVYEEALSLSKFEAVQCKQIFQEIISVLKKRVL
jgi:hypothetical protein